MLKKKQDAYEKLVEISRKDDYTTGSLLDYLYHQKYSKVIDIDLSRKTNVRIPQQLHRKISGNDDATMSFIAENHKKHPNVFIWFINRNSRI